MFDTRITPEQREYAYRLCKKTNFGHRGKFDGNFERQYTGILGEVVMADCMGFDRPDGKGGFDNGIDFVILDKNIDLKTMGRTTEVRLYYVNNLIASQTAYQTDYYLFSSINKLTKVMTVIGYIKKENLDKYLKEEGVERTRSDQTTFNTKTAMYEIPNKDLIQVRSWNDVVWALHRDIVG